MGNALEYAQRLDHVLSSGTEISSNVLLQQPANLFQTGNDKIIRRASNLKSEPICATFYLSDHVCDTSILYKLAFSFANLT